MTRVRSLCATVAVAALLVLTGVSPATAADVTLPDPINVLPSTVKGSAPRGSGMEYLGAMIYKAMVTPASAGAAIKAKSGTATVTEAKLVADLVKNFKGMPATIPSGLTKVAAAAGPVGVTFGTFFAGAQIGDGIVNIAAMSNPAITDDALLCTSGNAALTAWVSIVNGADCAGFEKQREDFIANQDATGGGVSGGRVCATSAPARCFTLAGRSEFKDGSGATIAIYGFRGEGGATYLYWRPESRRDDNAWGWNQTELQKGDAAQAPFYGPGACGRLFSAGTYCLTNYEVPDPSRLALAQYAAESGSAVASPVAQPSDPERRLECRVALSDGSSRVTETREYRESEGVVPAVVCPTDLPPELEVDGVSIWQVGGGLASKLWESEFTPEFTTVKENMADCLNGSCILELKKEGVSCLNVPGPCADWFTDPNKGSKYSCNFGTYVVDLAECTVYAPYFKPGAVYTGSPLGDPTTGQPMPNPGVNPTVAPGATPVPEGGASAECFPSGWGVFNPFSWVLLPIQCGMRWAFVPSPLTLAQTQAKLDVQVKGTAFGQVSTTLNSLFLPFGGVGQGCAGPPWRFDFFGVNETFYPFSACNEPVAGAASFVNGMLGITVVFGTALAVLRYVTSTIGFIGFGGTVLHKLTAGKGDG